MIGILSDSHDNREALKQAVRIFNERECSLVIHAGDFVAPFAAGELAALRCSVKAVFGNCDGEKAGLKKTLAPFGAIADAPIRIEHGELVLLVVHVPFQLEEYLRSGKYAVAICGHTHKPEVRRIGETLLVNPGETGGWVTGRKTVALLDPVTQAAEIIAF